METDGLAGNISIATLFAPLNLAICDKAVQTVNGFNQGTAVYIVERRKSGENRNSLLYVIGL